MPILIWVSYSVDGGHLRSLLSSAYATVIVLAISFAIAAIGGLLYYGLQNMSSARYGYAADSYDYQR